LKLIVIIMFRKTLSYLKNVQSNKLVFAAAGVGMCSFAHSNPEGLNQSF
jgi:hypothetical protein